MTPDERGIAATAVVMAIVLVLIALMFSLASLPTDGAQWFAGEVLRPSNGGERMQCTWIDTLMLFGIPIEESEESP